MNVEHSEFVPDPDLSHEEMEALQHDLVSLARFSDDFGFDPEDVRLSGPVEESVEGQQTLGEGSERDTDAPIVVGVDQAFLEEESVSAAVAIQDGVVVERVCGHAPLEIPYIPGLLAFREGGAIIDAFSRLSVDPDLLVLDGNGRIHFRQAGIATHVGVLFDTPAVGVAKNLLCGKPVEPVEGPLAEGERIPIEAGDDVDAPTGTTIGHVYQSRQYPNPEKRHVNPIYVSSGHRVSAESAVELVDALCGGYKLPEPTRLADSHADVCKREGNDGS